MLQAMKEVYHYFQIYFNNSSILYFYISCMIILCFMGKEKRRLIVYPSLLIFIVIANPVLYRYVWLKLIGGTYWRMVWMIPVVPVIVCTVIAIIDKFNKKYASIVVTVAFMAVITLTNVRIYSRRTHVDINNAYKVPDSTVAVCNYLLEAENGGNVDVIMPASIYCYARQYDSRIHQLYGRDAEHYMAHALLSEDEKNIARDLLSTEPDIEYVTRVAKDNDCKYIVFDVYNNVDDGLMNEYGYSLMKNESGYKIYRIR